MSRSASLLLTLALLLAAAPTLAARTVPAIRVAEPPQLDGAIKDSAWQAIQPLAVHDQAADVDILLRAAYDDEQVYFLVMYPDQAANTFHKPWVWDKDGKSYAQGPHREDTFIFKWRLDGDAEDLSVFAESDYRADLWYWKADRTNQAGYADDKIHILRGPVDSSEPEESAREENEGKRLQSPSGRVRFLIRKSDAGRSAYRSVDRPADFVEPVVAHYAPREPSGSRGDVRAKGVWNSGFWFIEFARKLQTGHDDDVQFRPGAETGYLFGVSIFSVYGNPLDRSQPNLYGMGRISEPLELVFR